MNCPEYESVWNERLDARDAGSTPSLERHAAECPSCRALGARYHALSQAIQALEPLPMSPDGFVDRVLAAASTRPAVVPMPRRVVWRLAPFAAAAALIPVVFLIPRALAACPRTAGGGGRARPDDRTRRTDRGPGGGDLGDVGPGSRDVGSRRACGAAGPRLGRPPGISPLIAAARWRGARGRRLAGGRRPRQRRGRAARRDRPARLRVLARPVGRGQARAPA